MATAGAIAVVAIGIGVVIASAAPGLYPAAKAARLSPTETLRAT